MVSFGNVATPATRPPQPPYTALLPTARPRDSGSYCIDLRSRPTTPKRMPSNGTAPSKVGVAPR